MAHFRILVAAARAGHCHSAIGLSKCNVASDKGRNILEEKGVKKELRYWYRYYGTAVEVQSITELGLAKRPISPKVDREGPETCGKKEFSVTSK